MYVQHRTKYGNSHIPDTDYRVFHHCTCVNFNFPLRAHLSRRYSTHLTTHQVAFGQYRNRLVFSLYLDMYSHIDPEDLDLKLKKKIQQNHRDYKIVGLPFQCQYIVAKVV